MNILQAIEMLQKIHDTDGNLQVCFLGHHDDGYGFYAFEFPSAIATIGMPEEGADEGGPETPVCAFMFDDVTDEAAEPGDLPPSVMKVVK